MTNRRVHDRVAVNLSIRIRRGAAVVSAQMTDLSLGGFLIKTLVPVQLDKRLPVQLGQHAEVDFEIDDERFASDAVMIRIEGTGVAFQFVDPTEAMQRNLAGHLDRLEARPESAEVSDQCLTAVGSSH